MARSDIRILIADDEVFIRQGLQEALQRPGFSIEAAADGHQARQRIRGAGYDLIIMDLRMPGPGGMELLEEVRELRPDTQTIILTAHGNVSTAVEAMKKGAFDFLTKPVDLEHLRLLVSRACEHLELMEENRELHSRLENQDSFRRLVRRSAAMQAAAATIKQVAMSDVPLLLRGETGAGKDLIARIIHERSSRHDRDFVAVNCGGFTEELFSSELFGHVRGAFTGAHANKPGRFALAEGGTLFLDEIGEVPLKNQVELLRVLESGEYQPVGDPQVHYSNVRVIAATNRNLEEGVQQGSFREDLYYRLNVVPVAVPPLRERHEDIPVLVGMFLEEACRAQNQLRLARQRPPTAQPDPAAGGHLLGQDDPPRTPARGAGWHRRRSRGIHRPLGKFGRGCGGRIDPPDAATRDCQPPRSGRPPGHQRPFTAVQIKKIRTYLRGSLLRQASLAEGRLPSLQILRSEISAPLPDLDPTAFKIVSNLYLTEP